MSKDQMTNIKNQGLYERASNRVYSTFDGILAEVDSVLKRIDVKELCSFVKILRKKRKIYIAGVGRSGLVVKAFGQRLMHLGFDVHLADEITAPAITKNDMLICCSGTGTTQLVLFMAKKARSIGSYVVSLTASASSPLAKYSETIVVVPSALSGGSGRSGVRTRQPARSLFEQALFILFDAIVMELARELKIPTHGVSKRHANLE